MKLKHVMWIVAGFVAVVSMAAGVAVLIDHFVNKSGEDEEYIECECEPDEE